MPGHQQMCPDTSSENEKGKVRCHHRPSCTKWMTRHTRNTHWRTMLVLLNEAQGKCMRCVSRVSTAHSWFFFCQLWMPVMQTMRVPAARLRSLLLTFIMRVPAVIRLLLTFLMSGLLLCFSMRGALAVRKCFSTTSCHFPNTTLRLSCISCTP